MLLLMSFLLAIVTLYALFIYVAGVYAAGAINAHLLRIVLIVGFIALFTWIYAHALRVWWR